MAFDCYVMAAAIAEISTDILPAKINKIHQPDSNTIVLRYYSPNGSGKILLSAHAAYARIHKSAELKQNPDTAPLFLMVMRKWLEGATLKSIEQTPYERVATLHFITRNEVGDNIKMRLIIEIMNKHSNIILVNEEGQIVDGIHRYDFSRSRYREVLPNRPYLAPPPLNKSYLPLKSSQALAELLIDTDDSLEQAVAPQIAKKLAGLSPKMAEDLLLAANLSTDLSIDQLGEYELELIFKQLNDLAALYQEGKFRPVIRRQNGIYRDFAAYPAAAWLPEECLYFAGMGEALNAFYQQAENLSSLNQYRQSLKKKLGQHLNRLQKKINLQQADLKAAEKGDSYKEMGDLLAANLYHIQQIAEGGRGLEQVELNSFNEPYQVILIKLDPSKNPQQNIQHYYHKYNKCRKAYVQISNHLAENEQELEYLQTVANSLEQAMEIAELDEIVKELRQGHYLPPLSPHKKGNKKPKKEGESLPPRQYISADGFKILIGRNNKQNDRLTFKIGQPDDIWLHSQKIPGSHVIIVSDNKQVPESTIIEAAEYAGWYSQARAGNRVPIDYTKLNQVKKPNGAKPGMVNYFQQKTLYITPKEPQEQTNTAAEDNI